ncbi:alpha/beta fold hydrolase, partial [Rhizobium ruizarguesonis]
GLVTLETTKFQYTDGMGDVAHISPDNWVVDQALLDRPGNKDIQLDLLGDYGSNVPLYPQFQAFFRERQPPTLIVWGKNDKIFPEPGAHPYLRDLPNAEMHILDSGEKMFFHDAFLFQNWVPIHISASGKRTSIACLRTWDK